MAVTYKRERERERERNKEGDLVGFAQTLKLFLNSWGLRPQTPIWSAFGLHMDPFWVHMDPKIHWGPFGPILELGPYIGSTWDPIWGPPGTRK